MLSIGTLVVFTWWSSYRAPSAVVNELGHATWHEIKPGDKGVVVGHENDENLIVLFSSVDSLLRVNRVMLVKV